MTYYDPDPDIAAQQWYQRILSAPDGYAIMCEICPTCHKPTSSRPRNRKHQLTHRLPCTHEIGLPAETYADRHGVSSVMPLFVGGGAEPLERPD